MVPSTAEQADLEVPGRLIPVDGAHMLDGTFGKYQLIAELGQGGMADVFLAAAQGPAGFRFSKLLVVKRLRENLLEEPEFVGMLMDEARIAARLNHPNVVQTLEVGKVDRHYFIAMEYLEGQPLHRILNRAQRRDGGMPKGLHYRVLSQVLAGLHHAHELKDYDGTSLDVVHRDVTPHNVFVTYEGQTKLVDFGIAKAVGRVGETRTGVVKGKVTYMAPEQALSAEVDRSADIFAVGVMLWEAATGRRMWQGKPDVVLINRLVTGDIPASPRDVDPTVPQAIDEICRRALAYEAADRFPTAAAFKAELDQFIESQSLLPEERGDAPRKGTAPGATTPSLGEYVTGLFEETRVKLTKQVERQMAALEETRLAEGITPPLDRPAEPAIVAEETTDVSLTAAGTPAIAGIARTRYLTIGAALVVALGVAFVGLRPPTDPREPTSSVTETVDASSTPASTPVDAAVDPPKIAVALGAQPPEARFYLDGTALDCNPCALELPADARKRELRVVAQGYVEQSAPLVLDKNVQFETKLERVPTQPTPPSKLPAPPKVQKPGAEYALDERDPWQ